jgi:hypothetical protein
LAPIPKIKYQRRDGLKKQGAILLECYGKAISLQTLTSPEGSRRLRLPDF